MPSAQLWEAPDVPERDARETSRALQFAWALSLVATASSLSLSGIPAIGWAGQGLVPCELCWYQRILMYPLVLLLGSQAFRDDRELSGLALSLSVPGVVVAGYHSLIQVFPGLEAGQCLVGTCSATLWTAGPLTVPNLSLLAFLGISTVLWWSITHE